MHEANKFRSLAEAQNILGEDFWEIISDIIPFIGPKIDMCKAENHLLIVAELPGIDSSKDVQIQIDRNAIVLKGNMSQSYVTNEQVLIKNERYHGPFMRKIDIPPESIVSQMKAQFKNGLLYINIPLKTEDTFSRQEIPIQFNDEFSEM